MRVYTRPDRGAETPKFALRNSGAIIDPLVKVPLDSDKNDQEAAKLLKIVDV